MRRKFARFRQKRRNIIVQIRIQTCWNYYKSFYFKKIGKVGVLLKYFTNELTHWFLLNFINWLDFQFVNRNWKPLLILKIVSQLNVQFILSVNLLNKKVNRQVLIFFWIPIIIWEILTSFLSLWYFLLNNFIRFSL